MKKVEIFSAGCSACTDTIDLLEAIPGSKEVEILNMKDPKIADRAKKLGIKSVPTVLVDGRLADCCSNRGVRPETVASMLG